MSSAKQLRFWLALRDELGEPASDEQADEFSGLAMQAASKAISALLERRAARE